MAQKEVLEGQEERQGKGRGNVAEALQEDMENVPPPAIRQNAHPRQRWAHGLKRVNIAIGPAPSRGRVTNSMEVGRRSRSTM